MIVCSGMRFIWELQMRGLVNSIKCEECVFASDNSLSDSQSEPPWASKYNLEDQSQKFKHLVYPGRGLHLALFNTLAWIKGVRRHSLTIVQTLLLSWRHCPGYLLVGRRLDGVPVLEPFLECRQIVVHPALIQPDGFQSFLHTPHLRAALLQTGEEPLHLHNTKIHIEMMTYNTENSAISSSLWRK